jgi:uncharacterized cupredoxin-like copper-binding protein
MHGMRGPSPDGLLGRAGLAEPLTGLRTGGSAIAGAVRGWVNGGAIALLLVLLIGLTGCTRVGPGPTAAIVEKAIALQLSQTQQLLSKQLKLDPTTRTLTVQHVAITDKAPLTIDNLQAFRVHGTYDFTLKQPQRAITQRQNPFEVVLQRQVEGKTWRLARLETEPNGSPIWITQRLPE